MDLDRMKERAAEAVDRLCPELFELADRIFAHPEVAFQEERAAAWLAGFLENQGFSVERGLGGLPTAFRGECRGEGGEGARVAFISEYDALPELGHACGHNVIATIGVGAAAALAAYRGELPGTFLSLGTPAEEGGGGKVKLIEAGLFEGVEAAMMIHPSDAHRVSRGSLGRVKLRVEFRGKPAHAAAHPHLGVNALDALVSAYQNVGLLRQQLAPDVRIHAMITHGGSAPNIIPDYAAALFYVRALDRDYLRGVVARVRACAEGAALAHGAKVEVTEDPPRYEPIRPNAVLSELYAANLRRLGEEEAPAGPEGMGSSDIGNVSWLVPTIHPYIRLAPPGVKVHTREFAQAAGSGRGHEAIRLGAKLLAMTALDVLLVPGNRERVRRAFREG